MPTAFATALACLLAHSTGAKAGILPSSALPESKLLVLLGGGLVVLAALVRRLYPFGNVAAPKSLHVMLWMSPEEIAEQFSAGDGD
jgi:hypothetical protein